jgi:hypothetical protein
VLGAPAAMGYCHCESCRRWSAGPVNAFTLWPTAAVTVTRGSHLLGSYAKTERSKRTWCTACGGHVLTEHPHWDLIDVYAAVLRDFAFEPGVHVNYSETVLASDDVLPKQHDLPKEMGGSGMLIGERARVPRVAR